MKKILFALAFGSLTFGATAQVNVHGTSPYSENFDGIASGLPSGWNVFSGAGFSFLGSLTTLNTTASFPSYLASDSTCIAQVLAGGFKNYPSAVAITPGMDWCSSSAPTISNRALGVRQVSPTNSSHPNLDSGAAFVFQITGTKGMTNVGMSFLLQSLDSSSPRTTTWRVDYAIGASTTYNTATTTTGTLTTGGHTFSNNLVTANFGSALDNIGQTITFRIVTLAYSSGTGNRATTAIDSFKLTWTGTAINGIEDLYANNETGLTVLGNATSENVNFAYNVDKGGDYNFAIYDLSGRVVYTETLNTTPGTHQFNVANLNIAPGMYIAKMNNGLSSAVAKITLQ